jgi:hypothetical protein
MLRPFQQHPDLIPVVIAFFDANLPAYHVAGDLTGWEKPEEWITIQPTGGTVSRIRTGEARMDVNVYAPTKPEAFGISMAAIKTLMQMINYTNGEAVITNVECSYPADISDPLNSNPRYVFDVIVSYRTN